jgi:hypothetical protein
MYRPPVTKSCIYLRKRKKTGVASEWVAKMEMKSGMWQRLYKDFILKKRYSSIMINAERL